MNKYYCDYYKGEELKTVNVNAKNIEKAAKKIFKTNKKKFSAEYVEQFVQAFPGQVFHIITNDQEPSPPLDEPNTNGLEGISNDDDDPQTLVS